ncbi:hypothetical protein QW131_17540 [Roseibium salinum]|nr:hypothetical protein [Roseibium salinum]
MKKLIVRGVRLLDYTPGGPDFRPDHFDLDAGFDDPTMRDMFGFEAKVDIGAGDEIHGETGDDTIYGAGGNDSIFGDAQDDDIIGGWGHDWISGGVGTDGILGDDGRIYTSRNSATHGEKSLRGRSFARPGSGHAHQPGQRTQRVHLYSRPGADRTDQYRRSVEKKSVDLTPFDLAPGIDDPLFVTSFADDIIFGGLGDDFIHGGGGDDAIGGGEALSESYAPRIAGSELDENGQLRDLIGLVRIDFSRPYNPGNVLLFGADTNPWNAPKPVQSRLGEFYLYDEYDPRRVILFDEIAGETVVWKDDSVDPSTLKHYFLNQLDNEGFDVLGYIDFKPNGDPIGDQVARETDGDDRIFGDHGNDWIVGGTGRDRTYGGWGNDLLNADDVFGGPGTSYDDTRGLNDAPDTHLIWEDRAFGGAGLDILIGNTGGDRLIDWAGEYNSYIVPFAPFGIATVSRQVPPHLFDFLSAQAASDGVDITRTSDTGIHNSYSRYSNVRQLLGDPFGEMGLVMQRDHGLWQDQTGGPTDPQPGNIPGGRRDVLRSADVNDGVNPFAVDQGNFVVQQGKVAVTAESKTSQSAAVFYVDAYLPVYYEIAASLTAQKPTGGWKANAYIIFDYYSETDFKYAGINISNDQIEMGYRDETGWHQVVKSNKPVQLKPGQSYDVLVAVNGTNVTVAVAGVNWFSYTFDPRIVEGVPVALNRGLVGFGNDGSKSTVDNFTVQILPPELTLDYTDNFDGAGTYELTASDGWAMSAGRLVAEGGAQVNTVDIGTKLQVNSYLELETAFNSQGLAGIAFDVYGPSDYKFVALDAANDLVLVGHVSLKGGYQVDATYSRAMVDGVDHKLRLSLLGASVSISVDGAFVTNHGFYSALVDGGVGLMNGDQLASFDKLSIRTNDPYFDTSDNLLSAGSNAIVGSVDLAITREDALGLLDDAIVVWRESGQLDASQLAALGKLDIQVVDLADGELAQSVFGAILIDRDAAGHGWFVDLTPLQKRRVR